MSTNFWDVKVGDEESPSQPTPLVEKGPPVENKATKVHSDAVLFSNPLVIDVDGNKIEIPLERSNELSEQAINLILKAKEYWMIELAPGNRFFQMDVQTAEIEHWQDGEIIHQQRGDIGQVDPPHRPRARRERLCPMGTIRCAAASLARTVFESCL